MYTTGKNETRRKPAFKWNRLHATTREQNNRIFTCLPENKQEKQKESVKSTSEPHCFPNRTTSFTRRRQEILAVSNLYRNDSHEKAPICGFVGMDECKDIKDALRWKHRSVLSHRWISRKFLLKIYSNTTITMHWVLPDIRYLQPAAEKSDRNPSWTATDIQLLRPVHKSEGIITARKLLMLATYSPHDLIRWEAKLWQRKQKHKPSTSTPKQKNKETGNTEKTDHKKQNKNTKMDTYRSV
jgi:hypothetical protein